MSRGRQGLRIAVFIVWAGGLQKSERSIAIDRESARETLCAAQRRLRWVVVYDGRSRGYLQIPHVIGGAAVTSVCEG
jgi:hypothetical protein